MSAEFDFIRWIESESRSNPSVLVGPGDDCAVLAPLRRDTLVTTDVLMEGTDFILADAGAFAVGRKAMAVNISDIAAMAGRPTAALVGLVLPQSHSTAELARELFAGLDSVASEFGIPIVGGDTNSWNGGLVISVTVLGEAPESGAVLRSGAKPGDAIFVTGPCGGSILGRHLNPQPRLREIERIAVSVKLTSCIDISDGLTADLQHILAASGCGAILDADAIPIHPDAISLSQQTGTPTLEHALGDGEDFELIFTTSLEDSQKLKGEPHAILIGECTESGFQLRDSTGVHPLRARGWVHAFTGAE